LLVEGPERPHLDLSYLKRVEHAHRYGVGALIRQVPADASSQSLLRLPDVDGFGVIVVEQVHAELAVTDSPTVGRNSVQGALHALIEGIDLGR